MQDEVRTNILRVRRVNNEENVADLGTKAPSNAVISRHAITLGCVNTDEERVEGAQQDVAMLWDFWFRSRGSRRVAERAGDRAKDATAAAALDPVNKRALHQNHP